MSERAILFDDRGLLVLLRRTRPGGETYLTTPGGGGEPGERPADAAARECREELGAVVAVGREIDVPLAPDVAAGSLRFHLARLVAIDPALRTGHEHDEPWRGTYEEVRLGLRDAALAELRPATLAPLLAERGVALAAEAARIPG